MEMFSCIFSRTELQLTWTAELRALRHGCFFLTEFPSKQKLPREKDWKRLLQRWPQLSRVVSLNEGGWLQAAHHSCPLIIPNYTRCFSFRATSYSLARGGRVPLTQELHEWTDMMKSHNLWWLTFYYLFNLYIYYKHLIFFLIWTGVEGTIGLHVLKQMLLFSHISQMHLVPSWWLFWPF